MPLAPATADRLSRLPRFFTYRDVLEDVFLGNESAFVDAWVDGALPPAVCKACEETASPRTLELQLLRRIVQVLQADPEPLP